MCMNAYFESQEEQQTRRNEMNALLMEDAKKEIEIQNEKEKFENYEEAIEKRYAELTNEENKAAGQDLLVSEISSYI